VALIRFLDYSQGTGVLIRGNDLEVYSGSQLSREGEPVATWLLSCEV
jgi:hypothetical protein